MSLHAPGAPDMRLPRTEHSAFHHYVRAVFAERSRRARTLRASRASWLHRLSRSATITIGATNLYSRD